MDQDTPNTELPVFDPQNPTEEQRDIIEFLKLTGQMANSIQFVAAIGYDNFKSGRAAFCLGMHGLHLRVRMMQKNAPYWDEEKGMTLTKDMFQDHTASIKRGYIVGVDIQKRKVIFPQPDKQTPERTEIFNDLIISTVGPRYIIPNLTEDCARNWRNNMDACVN